MKRILALALIVGSTAFTSSSHAETRRVCDDYGRCSDVSVSPACRDGVDQYTGQLCVPPLRPNQSAPPRPGCGPNGINQYTGQSC